MDCKKIVYIVLIIFVVLGLAAFCFWPGHLCSDMRFRYQVENDFSRRMELFSSSECIGDVMEAVESVGDRKEKMALKFLYAYMPLGDITDYDGEFWKNNVKCSFLARSEMPWGNDVPEILFRHYVLPLRVNNENLDTCRSVFFKELKDRVKGLTMHDAVLEVNHWCHEKVSYAPSDIRTSSPLATVRTSWGRCGEESVFCISALRSVGIPARQIYAPRWAHRDDNHAWVEAWVDGKWHYLGACEPAPKLDMAWFSSDVTRAMLLHTKVFGHYSDNDMDLVAQTQCYTELNVTKDYVPVSEVRVRVVDEDNCPVRDAKIEFRLYNFAEFHPIVKGITDEKGYAAETFGMGDILVWASKGDKYGYRKVSVGKDAARQKSDNFIREFLECISYRNHETVTVILDRKEGDSLEDAIDVFPPVGVEVADSDSLLDGGICKARLAQEDSIRAAYQSAFPSGDKYTVSACGNWEEIESFIFFNSSTDERRTCAERMLDLINEKDLRDSQCDVLMDHILNYYKLENIDPSTSDYLLNPRVSNEMLTPCSGFFRERFGDSLSVESILDVTSKIKVMDSQNPAGIPISPIGVVKIGAADSHSRDIFFVSLCRTYGIPSRLNPVNSHPEYIDNGKWISADFECGESVRERNEGRLVLEYDGKSISDDPCYELCFTISRIENGSPGLLNFSNREGKEGSVTWKTTFASGITLEEGSYLLTTGTRLTDGNVLSNLTVFNVVAGREVKVPLKFR